MLLRRGIYITINAIKTFVNTAKANTLDKLDAKQVTNALALSNFADNYMPAAGC